MVAGVTRFSLIAGMSKAFQLDARVAALHSVGDEASCAGRKGPTQVPRAGIEMEAGYRRIAQDGRAIDRHGAQTGPRLQGVLVDLGGQLGEVGQGLFHDDPDAPVIDAPIESREFRGTRDA